MSQGVCCGGLITLFLVLPFTASLLVAQASLNSFERFSRMVSELSFTSSLPLNPTAYTCMGHFEGGDVYSGSPQLPLPWRVVRYGGPGADAPAPAEAAAGEVPGTVTLQGQVWDMATGEMLPTVALEVYQKQSDGRITLAYTGRAPSGAFAVPLIRGVTHILIFSSTGYQPEAYYVAAGTDNTQQRSFYLKRRPLSSETAVASTSVVETGRPFQDKASLPVTTAKDRERLVIGSKRLVSILPELADIEPVYIPPGGRPAPVLFLGELKEATSLREGPSHETEVLLRFQAGDEVEILEKTDEHWWKARYNGQEGYVKAFLLRTI